MSEHGYERNEILSTYDWLERLEAFMIFICEKAILGSALHDTYLNLCARRFILKEIDGVLPNGIFRLERIERFRGHVYYSKYSCLCIPIIRTGK